MAESALSAAITEQSTVDLENPWPGLAPFLEADARFFRGRGSEAQELFRLVVREALIILFGNSGLGKSSLLQAGLFPLLRRDQEYLPVYIRLNFSSTAAGLELQVREAIAGHAETWGVEAPRFHPGDTLWENFHRTDADFWNRRNRPVTPLLVFDQFEETFTLGSDGPSRAAQTSAFLDQLADLAEARVPASVEARLNEHPDETELFDFSRHRYKVLLSLREDFLADLEGLRSRMPSIALHRLRLQRMDGKAAIQAVSHASHLIDGKVAEKVVRFVAAGDTADCPLGSLEVEPALLSVVCSELNIKRRSRGDAKITADLLEGSQEAILSDFYERAYEGIAPQVRTYIEQRLLTVNGFRNSDALVNALSEPGITAEAIEALVKRRLIRIEDRGGERIELIHDRLASVARASRDAAAERRRIEEEKRRLDQERVEALERARRQRLQDDARRNRWMFAGALVLACLFAAVAFWAFQQGKKAEQQAEIARQKEAEARKQKEAAESASEKARRAAKFAEQQTEIAKTERKKATEERQNAEAARGQAERAAADQAAARKEADKQSMLAAAAAVRAGQAAEAAAENEKIAKKQTELANEQTKVVKDQADRINESLAESYVVEAGRRVDLKRYNEALAYVAGALRANPKSSTAASLAFDLLIRGGLKPVEYAFTSSGPNPLVDRLVPMPAPVYSLDLNPSGTRAVAGLKNNTAHLFDVITGANEIDLKGHTGIVNFASFDPSGELVVTASQDKTARVWVGATGAPFMVSGTPVVLQHAGPVTSATFMGGKERVLTSSWDGSVVEWDIRSGTKVVRIAGATEPKNLVPINFVAYRDEKMAVGDWSGVAKVIYFDGSTLTLKHAKQINSVSMGAGVTAVTASNDGTAQIWSFQNPVGAPLRHGGPVNYAEFSPDSSRIATASDDRTARIWDAKSGAPVSIPFLHEGRVASAVFTRDGKRVITADFSGKVRIWEVRDRADAPQLLEHLAAAVSGLNVDSLPRLDPAFNRTEDERKVRDAASRSRTETAGFVKWFFTQYR